jgi:SNF family Na+-dependent transporter
MEETNMGSAKIKVTPIWGPVMKFVIPIIILVILVYGLAGENLA